MKNVQIAKWIVAILLVPLCINFVCVLKCPYTIVGDGTDWLGFFGSYIGGAITVLMTMWVIRSENAKEIARKRYENQKEYYDRLCHDIGELCGLLDFDRFSFLLQQLKSVKSGEGINSYIQELLEMDKDVKTTYNTFILRYSRATCQEQSDFLHCSNLFSGNIRDKISSIQDVLTDIQKTQDYSNLNSKVQAIINSIRDFLAKEQPFLIAKKWEKVEYLILNDLKTRYENC